MKTIMTKLGIIGFMILILWIPVLSINNLVEERQQRKAELIKRMGNVWGNPQQFSGIYLSGNRGIHRADTTNINGELKVSLRKKGIFKLPFYTAELTVSADFSQTAFRSEFNKINLIFSDIRTVKVNELKWGNKSISLASVEKKGKKISIVLPQLNGDNITKRNIKLKLKINGLNSLSFLANSNIVNVDIKSNWHSPNFTGAVLPLRRKISNDGFNAQWSVSKNLNIYEKNEKYIFQYLDVNHYSVFGVSLFVPVDTYLQVERSIKYAVLVIFLTFLTFFIFEILLKVPIHPVQYLLLGAGLIIFYMLLLSLSEYIGFGKSYLCASLATISLITYYSANILQKSRQSGVIAVLLSLLYLFLFTLLQLEHYALLFGSSSLFFILAVVMYVTRRINWYDLSRKLEDISVIKKQSENKNVSSKIK